MGNGRSRPAESTFLQLLRFFSHTIQDRTGFLNPLRSKQPASTQRAPVPVTGPHPVPARPHGSLASPHPADLPRRPSFPVPHSSRRGHRRGAFAVPTGCAPHLPPESRRAVCTSMSAASLLSTGAMAVPTVRSPLEADSLCVLRLQSETQVTACGSASGNRKSGASGAGRGGRAVTPRGGAGRASEATPPRGLRSAPRLGRPLQPTERSGSSAAAGSSPGSLPPTWQLDFPLQAGRRVGASTLSGTSLYKLLKAELGRRGQVSQD